MRDPSTRSKGHNPEAARFLNLVRFGHGPDEGGGLDLSVMAPDAQPVGEDQGGTLAHSAFMYLNSASHSQLQLE